MSHGSLDLEREHAVYYSADPQPRAVELGTSPFLALEGVGPLGGVSHREGVEALRLVLDEIRRTAEDRERPFEPAPLETLWTHGDPPERSDEVPDWTLLTRLPGFVHADRVDEARRAVDGSKAADRVEYRTLGEGTAVQALHEGERLTIAETYDDLHVFVDEHDLEAHAPAHEIHLDDPIPAQRARTVVRLPVQPA